MLPIARTLKQCYMSVRSYTSKIPESSQAPDKFETVFTFPHIKYLAMFNRLKFYHLMGSCVVVPSSGVLEWLNVLPQQSFLAAAYLGVTAGALLTVTSLPFKNIIGFLYISEDDKNIKISSINFWGKRVDRIVSADDWTPLFDMAPRKLDVLFLSPKLSDKTQYKWFVKFGKVLNAKKIGKVLE